MVWSLAAANMISAHSSTHDSNAPSSEMIRPTLISTAPQWPTTCSSTAAIDGFCSLANSGWVMIPRDSTFTSIRNSSTVIKPITVALPTSLRFSARDEKMLAPSMPINTQTVTSIMLRTWFITLPRSGFFTPQMSAVKMSSLNANNAISTNSSSGTTLATVVTRLMNAASLIPRSTRKCTAHNSTDAPITAAGVLPSPNIGKK